MKKDFLLLAVGMAYIIAGTWAVPFHGDEATHIFTGRDFYYVFVQRDLDRVAYDETPVNVIEQDLRFINGVIPRYLYGLAAWTGGYDIQEINGMWRWPMNWNWNVRMGNLPSERMLFRARLMSAFLLALGLLPIYFIGNALGGRSTALAASLLYALDPVLLLNGRRAMKEGGLVFFTLLAVLTGLLFLRKRSLARAAILGAAAGLAVAAKHSAALAVAAIFLGCALYPLLRQWRGEERWKPFLSGLVRHILILLFAGVLSLAVFLCLNPAWWKNPLTGARYAVIGHVNVLVKLVERYGELETIGEKLGAFVRHVVNVRPQYFEDSLWSAYPVISHQIGVYESSFWRGLTPGAGWLGAPLWCLAIVSGAVALILHASALGSSRFLVGTWFLFVLLSTFFLTPLDWQRYYLPLRTAAIPLAALGVTWLAAKVHRRLPRDS